MEVIGDGARETDAETCRERTGGSARDATREGTRDPCGNTPP